MLPLELVPFLAADPQVAAVLALASLAPAVLAVVLALVMAGRGGVRSDDAPAAPAPGGAVPSGGGT